MIKYLKYLWMTDFIYLYLLRDCYRLKDSAGMLHLKKLSDAGITHVHLLPTYHFAGVDDDKRKWQSVGTESLFIFAASIPSRFSEFS